MHEEQGKKTTCQFYYRFRSTRTCTCRQVARSIVFEMTSKKNQTKKKTQLPKNLCCDKKVGVDNPPPCCYMPDIVIFISIFRVQNLLSIFRVQIEIDGQYCLLDESLATVFLSEDGGMYTILISFHKYIIIATLSHYD